MTPIIANAENLYPLKVSVKKDLLGNRSFAWGKNRMTIAIANPLIKYSTLAKAAKSLLANR